MSFIDETYEVPSSGGNYAKIQDGDNRFRILSDVMLGYEYWTTEGKSKLLNDRPANKPADMREKNKFGSDEVVRECWFMKVYNYGEERMQILQFHQAGIKAPILALSRDEEWGHPKQYDIKIKRSGKEKETTYAVTASPAKPVNDVVKEAFKKQPINLAALFTGEDPFAGGEAAPAAKAPAPKAPAAKPQPKPQAVAAGGEEELDDNDLPF